MEEYRGSAAVAFLSVAPEAEVKESRRGDPEIERALRRILLDGRKMR